MKDLLEHIRGESRRLWDDPAQAQTPFTWHRNCCAGCGRCWYTDVSVRGTRFVGKYCPNCIPVHGKPDND